MTRETVENLARKLNDAGVRYLVVGGLAVNAHGYVRATVDVDLIIHLETANIRAALAILKDMGYTPRVPVPIEAFADAATRESWIRDKHMTVFSLRSDIHRETEVDIFVSDPLGFDRAYAERILFELASGIQLPVCSLRDLLQLKAEANRGKDQTDTEYLKKLHGLT